MHVVGTKVCVSQFSEQNIINKSSGVLLWKLTLCTNPRRSRSAVPTSLGWLRKVGNHGFKTSCLYNRWFSTTAVLPPITVRLPAQHWVFAFDTKVTKKKKPRHTFKQQAAGADISLGQDYSHLRYFKADHVEGGTRIPYPEQSKCVVTVSLKPFMWNEISLL